MKEVIKMPTSDSQTAGKFYAEIDYICKDSISSLPRQQRRILLHLARSKDPQSVADIIRALGQTDPRGHISRLRKKGFPIADIRCICEDGIYKRYYIRKEAHNE